MAKRKVAKKTAKRPAIQSAAKTAVKKATKAPVKARTKPAPKAAAKPARRKPAMLAAPPGHEDFARLRIRATTMGDLLLTAADRYPNKLALVFPDAARKRRAARGMARCWRRT